METNEHRGMLEIVQEGIREGVACALEQHKQASLPVYVGKDGIICEIFPDAIPINSSMHHALKEEGTELR